jgi:hypothetical protein
MFAAVASLSPALHAQSSKSMATFTVPFAFEYGSHHFASGAYTLQMLNPYIIAIHGNSGSALSMMQEASAGSSSRSKVVFTRYGDRYVLQEIWLAGDANYSYNRRSVPRKHAELASNPPASSRVEIAMLDGPASGRR